MKKSIKKIIAAATAAAALMVSVPSAYAYDDDYMAKREESMALAEKISHISGEFDYFTKKNDLDFEVYWVKKERESIGYNTVEYFDPKLKPVIDDCFYFTQTDISRVVWEYPEEWHRKSWIGYSISKFINKNDLSADAIWAYGNEMTKIVVPCCYADTKAKPAIEQFIKDSGYEGSGVDIEIFNVGSKDSGKTKKITDKYEALLLINDFIKKEKIGFTSADIDEPDRKTVDVTYYSSGHSPESREEGRAVASLNKVKEFVQKMNIDNSILTYQAIDDLLLVTTVEGEKHETITNASTINYMLKDHIQKNDLDAELVWLDEEKDKPCRIRVECVDPDVEKEIKAYAQKEKIDEKCVEYSGFSDEVRHIGLEMRLFMFQNGLNAYQRYGIDKTGQKYITIGYHRKDSAVPKKLKEFIAARKYDTSNVKINFKSLGEADGSKVTDIDKIHMLIYDFCFNENHYYGNSVIFDGNKTAVYFGDEWSGNDTQTPVKRFIEENNIDASKVEFRSVKKSIAEDVVPPEPTEPKDYTKSAFYLPGDADLSGEVSLSDVTALSKYNLNSKMYPLKSKSAECNADLNADGKIDSADLSILIEMNMGKKGKTA